MRPENEKGFSLVAAIFLLVVLALMGGIIASVTGIQQSSGQLDMQGVRAYQAARAGLEWGTYHVVDPGNAINLAAGSCAAAGPTACPTSPTHLSSLAGSLSGFTVSVTCTLSADTTESNRSVRVFQLVATACNQGGACPNANPANGYVERRLEATVSKCKDSSATMPRCSCG